MEGFIAGWGHLRSFQRAFGGSAKGMSEGTV